MSKFSPSTTFLGGFTHRSDTERWNNACRQLDAEHRSAIVSYLLRTFGLTRADAEEIAQLTFSDAIEELEHNGFDKARGSNMQLWLIGIARRRGQAHCRKLTRSREHAEGDLGAVACEDQIKQFQEREWRTDVLCRALARLQSDTRLDRQTITAFMLVTVYELAPRDVARALGTTVDNVHLAKHRCLAHLRELRKRIPSLAETPGPPDK